MIIPALVKYYDQLEQDPESDIAPYGFSRQQISFEVLLSPDGSSYEINDIREVNEKRSVPRRVVVFGQAKPSGSGLNPCLLWDNAQYMLGFKSEDNKPDRTTKTFEAFRDKHLELQDEIDDPGFDAVCEFLKSWDQQCAQNLADRADVLTNFGIFRIQGETRFVHERPQVHQWWVAQVEESGKGNEGMDAQLPNLITGEPRIIARLHEPKIKKIRDAQSSGATIVSFNQDAFESYGKEQGDNSPVGIKDAFKYCTALNTLTNDRARCIYLGDTTIVFWAEQSSPFECSILPAFMTGGGDEDSGTISELRSTFQSLRQGRKVNDIDPATPFYVLGLAPNAARLSIRFWITGTIADFAQRMDTHLSDLELEPPPKNFDLADLSIRRLIGETVPPKSGWADEEAISPLLAGSVLRAILTGGPYPRSLLSAVINRVRTEGMVYGKDKRKDCQQAEYRRCAIIKACLQRNARIAGHEKEIPVLFNPERPEVAYQLGRLFAALEKVQEDAMPGLNATIKDRYFGSASATPGVVFPRLTRMHQHHIEKLEGGLKVVREKLIQEIMGRLDTFPSHLSLDDQGLFAIGYYHQRQFFFTKKEDRPTEEPASA